MSDVARFVTLLGAVVIALAAIGLAVDLDRGDVREHRLEPVSHTIQATGTISHTPGDAPPGCIPACTSDQTRIQMRLDAPPIPGIQYLLDVGQHTLRFDGDRLDGLLTGDRRGDTATLRIEDGATITGLQLTPTIDTDASATYAAPATLQLEQIGAVEVSALIDSHLPSAPGQPTAWIDGTRLGDYSPDGDGWVFDERIERLRLDGTFTVRVGDTAILQATL